MHTYVATYTQKYKCIYLFVCIYKKKIPLTMVKGIDLGKGVWKQRD